MNDFGENLENLIFEEKNDGVLFRIRIIPNAKKNEIVKDNNIIKVRITAQPIDNKANKALIEFLSKLLKMPKSKIEIVKGQTSREKTLFIRDIKLIDIEKLMN